MSRIRSINDEITVTRKAKKVAQLWYQNKLPDYPDALKDYFNQARRLEHLLAERRTAKKLNLSLVQLGLFHSPEVILIHAELSVRRSMPHKKLTKHVRAILTLQHALQYVRMYVT